MSTNERDTYFQGFAQLLWDELKEFDPYDFDLTAKDSWQILHNGEGFDPSILEEHIKRIIAQRAYDLVFHILKNADDLYLDMGGYKDFPSDDTVVQNMKHLPDITQWPTIELTPDLPPELAE